MARARNIKPGFFKNEVLAELPCETRLLFIGLWTIADREGRLEDRPRRIKAELFPFDQFDADAMLGRLQDEGFLLRYEVAGERFVEITNFVKHQDPHYKEKASVIPPPIGEENKVLATNVTRTQRRRILERDNYKCQQCDSVNHLSIDHVIPVSRGGDSSDDNLQVLCFPCNTKKSNKLDGEASARKRDKHREYADFDPMLRGNRGDGASKSSQENDASPSSSLIPDSLIPDSLNLIPDSPIPEKPHVGLTPDAAQQTKKKNAELRQQASEIIAFLNEKAGRNFDLNGANADHIIARLKEGETVEDCRAVIALKCRAWKGDPKMAPYLRPETLFGRTKFASYKGELLVIDKEQP